MACPYCGEMRFTPSYLPSSNYNAKIFHYLKCASCNVIYISPFPDHADYQAMYPPGYQSGVDHTILRDKYKKLPGLRFSYGVQFDLISTYFPDGVKVLDYGCGNANFLVNAKSEGILCDGVEFNEAHVRILKSEIKGSEFFSINEFLHNNELKYDVIRLSNVLEHMDEPSVTIPILLSKLTPNGLLLVEGPLECNFNLAFLTRKIYFQIMHRIRKGYVATHAPTHITFTNAKNQLSFFNTVGLQTIEYKITEAEWPYPASVQDARGTANKIKAIIAKLSMGISSFNSKWGNTFLYVGRKKSYI